VQILLTTPFFHPYVRRGVERYVGELADWLAQRGHEVLLLTTAPDRSYEITRPSGARVEYVRAGSGFGRGRLHVDELLATLSPLWRTTRRQRDFDIIECHHYPDADGQRLSRNSYSIWLPGVPRRAPLGGRPLNRWAALYALKGARQLIALSDHAKGALSEEFGLTASVLPPGVNTDLYSGERPPVGEEEMILCAAAADDPRKRVGTLVAAFALLHRTRPNVRLVLAPPRPAAAETLVAGLPEGVRRAVTILSPDDPATLVELYQQAQVSVLPSVDEAFGLVIVESLAAGTPVVGARSGAIPEILGNPAVGRLSDPDDPESLAACLAETLDLSSRPETAEACRAWARRWDWDAVGERWLELHAP